jgi:hypothetical protein
MYRTFQQRGLAMREWSFSATAEWVVGVLLAAVIVAALFV